MFWAIIVQKILVTSLVINMFKIHFTSYFLEWQKSLPQSVACPVDVKALNLMNGVHMLSIMTTAFQRPKQNYIQLNVKYICQDDKALFLIIKG